MIGEVLSSEWCRCRQTADLAFSTYETKSFLNSFFSKDFSHNKENQIKELKEYIKNWKGEIIITDKELNILGRKKNNN